MGINVNKSFLGDSGARIPIESLKGKTIAVDALIYTIKYYNKVKTHAAARANLLRFLKRFSEHNINMIMVFDGLNKPELKNECIRKRKMRRGGEFYDDHFNLSYIKNKEDISLVLMKDNYKFTATHHNLTHTEDQYIQYVYLTCAHYNESYMDRLKENYPALSLIEMRKNIIIKKKFPLMPDDDHILELKKILCKKKYTVVEADGEGEKECCLLVKNGQADYIMSEDSDVFSYGGAHILKIIPTVTNMLIYYKMDDVLKFNGLNQEEFRSMCVLMGTDYQRGVRGFGYETIHAHLKAGKKDLLVEKYNQPHDGINMFDVVSKIFVL